MKCVWRGRLKILKDNLNGISNSFLIKKDYKAALNSFVGNIKFDLIFLDPPYKLNLISNILKFICDSNLLNDHGLVICEYENEDLVFEGLELIKSRRYGSKKVNIYKKF